MEETRSLKSEIDEVTGRLFAEEKKVSIDSGIYIVCSCPFFSRS